MDIPRDQFGGRRGGLSALADDAVTIAPLDWSGLTARLAAAHAARQILRLLPDPRESTGSFAPGMADDLAGWRAAASGCPGRPWSPGVNLDTKADGKSLGTIAPLGAGKGRSVVRGHL